MSCYLVNEPVLVWSETEKKLLDGVILEFGSGKRTGAVKVAYLAPGVGTKEKWIPPVDVGGSLQKVPRGVLFTQGASLQICAGAHRHWFNAVVIDVATAEMAHGSSILATGSVKVQYTDNGNVEDWVRAEERSVRLRAALPEFSHDEQVEVLDPSSSRWFHGSVVEVASHTQTHSVGSYSLQIAAGSPRITYVVPDQGMEDKWIPLELCLLRVKKTGGFPESRHSLPATATAYSPPSTAYQAQSYEAPTTAPQMGLPPTSGYVSQAPPYASLGASGTAPATQPSIQQSPYEIYSSYEAPQHSASECGSHHPEQSNFVGALQHSDSLSAEPHAMNTSPAFPSPAFDSFGAQPGVMHDDHRQEPSINAGHDPTCVSFATVGEPKKAATKAAAKRDGGRDGCMGRKMRGDACALPPAMTDGLNRLGLKLGQRES